MFLARILVAFQIVAIFLVTPALAQERSYTQPVQEQPPARKPDPITDVIVAIPPRDLAPDAGLGTSFVRVDSDCIGRGHLLELDWSMSPGSADARVVINLQIPGDEILRLAGLPAKGTRSLVLTPAGTGRANLDISFIDDASRASARANLSLPYPDTGSAVVEAYSEKSELKGKLNAVITACPSSDAPLGAVRSPREAALIAQESSDVTIREENAAFEPLQIFLFGTAGAGRPSNPALGPQVLASNEPDFDLEKMAVCIEREMYDRNVMGYAYAIGVDRQLLVGGSGAGGWARSPAESGEDGLAFSVTTPSHVASVSKPITAMAIMKLVQDGQLSLGEAFYPLVQSEYPNAGAGVDQVTIRQLLQHNSGLLPNYCGSTAESIAADTAGGGYSNINYCVLREVVEHVSGETYVDYVQSELLDPANIGGMSCAPGNANPTRYYSDADDNSGGDFSDYTDLCGAYGWYASAIDLGQLMAHYRNHTTLSQSIAEDMRTDCNGVRCLGFRTRSSDQGTAFGHSGAWTINGNGSRAGIGYFPRGIDAAIVMNSSGGSGFPILRDAYNQAFDGGCIAPPEPPGPPSCPASGCGTAINGLCAVAGDYPDGNQTPLAFNPFIRQNHPDGAAAFNQYCEDHPELLNYTNDAPQAELVCARANLSSGGPYNVCKGCGVDGKFWPGCECNPNQADACGPGLTCFGASGYGNGSTSFSSGKCWDVNAGPPIWECEADCTAVYGGLGYCHHGALPWEAAGTPICASTLCDLGGKVCAEQGLFCNVDSGACEVECNGNLHNPSQGLYSCQGRGYGSEFACNMDSQRCFIGGTPHP